MWQCIHTTQCTARDLPQEGPRKNYKLHILYDVHVSGGGVVTHRRDYPITSRDNVMESEERLGMCRRLRTYSSMVSPSPPKSTNISPHDHVSTTRQPQPNDTHGTCCPTWLLGGSPVLSTKSPSDVLDDSHLEGHMEKVCVCYCMPTTTYPVATWRF
jgi:hypothetical protein